MAQFYRVFPQLPRARLEEPGGALFIPPQGGGRLDNPDLFRVLYLSDSAAGAIAEAFGRFPEWTASMLAGSPSLPGSHHALAQYSIPPQLNICNLDDARQLLELDLRPSEVVSRVYETTRGWARRIFAMQREPSGVRWKGVSWWSYYDPRWKSVGLWDTRSLRVEAISRLNLDHPALHEAAGVITRRILSGPPVSRRRVAKGEK